MGRTSDLQMLETENLQLNILEISAETVDFELCKNEEKSRHQAKIVDNQGIFGVEFPKEISLFLAYYPVETKQFIGKAREIYFAGKKLKAA